jgi:hypothetical protein
MEDPMIIDITSSFNDEPMITLKTDDLPTSGFGGNDKPSVNFGGGLELLMNDKRITKKSSTSNGNGINEVDLGDLTELENELNSLTQDHNEPVTTNTGRNNLFGDSFKLNRDDDKSTKSIVSFGNLGKSTANVSSNSEFNNKTWDGFSKFNNVPINPDKTMSEKPKMTPEELLLEKFKVLRKLEDLERKGANLTKKYTMESSLAEMQGEYEMIISEKERSNSCKFQGRMLMAAITGLEFLNNRFDPFDVKLDGWAEQVNENINEYDEIFAELHEKYKSKAKMAPELKLLFQLGGSAIMVHMTNTMFKSAMPGMDDIMRQNPELMQQFTQAAVNTMGTTNPGFSGFVNNFMPGGGPPPPPVATQEQNGRSQRTVNMPSSRPDLKRARQEQGQGIQIDERFGNIGAETSTPMMKSSPRPEMKGPTDINDLLSGIKTKSINLPPTTSMASAAAPLSFVKSPAKRKNKSDKNTISLDF